MKPLPKYILLLSGFEILILIAGFLLPHRLITELYFREIFYLSLSFAAIAIAFLIIFFRGQKRDPASQTIHMLVSISIKFLAELVMALIWFFVAKKTGLSSVILFFILYLAFTLFLVLIVLKTLKYKSL